MSHAGGSVAAWRVAEVSPSGRCTLVVRFLDGLCGEVDLGGFLASPAVVGTSFEPLRNEAFFRQAQATEGVVRWPNGADLAPDAMYDAIRAAGRWVVP
ncbi:MAG: DUF2442 domain-containing protein [Planctomycetota bacterium]